MNAPQSSEPVVHPLLKRLKKWPKLEVGGLNLESIQKVMQEAAGEIERQRKEIAGLNRALQRKASDESPSFSPNFDERNGIR